MPASGRAVHHHAEAASASSSSDEAEPRARGREGWAEPAAIGRACRCGGDVPMRPRRTASESPVFPSYSIPNAPIRERFASAAVNSEAAGWNTPVSRTGSPVSMPNGTMSSTSKSIASPIRTTVLSPSSMTCIGARSTPSISPMSGARPPSGLPSGAEDRRELLHLIVGCAIVENTPTRQFPSVITFGVSATAASVRPLTSVPSMSPLSRWKTSVTLHRSSVAPSASDAVHGQTTSHEQVYEIGPRELPGHALLALRCRFRCQCPPPCPPRQASSRISGAGVDTTAEDAHERSTATRGSTQRPVQNLPLLRRFLRVSEGTRTPDRLDHNQETLDRVRSKSPAFMRIW